MATNSKRSRIKAPEIQAPQSLAEAEALLLRIGTLQRQVLVIETEMNDRMAAIKAEHEERAAPIVEAVELDFMGLQVWAEANRGSLLEGRRKTASVATGEIGWRTSPPAVRITGVDAVIAAFKQLKLTRFLRTKEEIDKEAIKRDPEAVAHVKGVSITQQEEFWIKPFESQIERSRAKKVNDPAAAQKAES